VTRCLASTRIYTIPFHSRRQCKILHGPANVEGPTERNRSISGGVNLHSAGASVTAHRKLINSALWHNATYPWPFQTLTDFCDPELSLGSFLLAAFHSIQGARVLGFELQRSAQGHNCFGALVLCAQYIPTQRVSCGARCPFDADVHTLKRLFIAFRLEELSARVNRRSAATPSLSVRAAGGFSASSISSSLISFKRFRTRALTTAA
jgi:hypothetical protein